MHSPTVQEFAALCAASGFAAIAHPRGILLQPKALATFDHGAPPLDYLAAAITARDPAEQQRWTQQFITAIGLKPAADAIYALRGAAPLALHQALAAAFSHAASQILATQRGPRYHIQPTAHGHCVIFYQDTEEVGRGYFTGPDSDWQAEDEGQAWVAQ